MGRLPEELIPRVRLRWERVLASCNALWSDRELSTGEGYRSPLRQAKLWRQGQSGANIALKVKEYRLAGYNHLADLIESVGPQSGPKVTNAPPLQSSHQYWAGVDGIIKHDGKPLWAPYFDDNDPWVIKSWQEYGEVVTAHGLMWGGKWKKPDRPHAQDVNFENARARLFAIAAKRIITMEEVEAILETTQKKWSS